MKLYQTEKAKKRFQFFPGDSKHLFIKKRTYQSWTMKLEKIELLFNVSMKYTEADTDTDTK